MDLSSSNSSINISQEPTQEDLIEAFNKLQLNKQRQAGYQKAYRQRKKDEKRSVQTELEELQIRTRRLEEALTAKERELEEVKRELKPHYEFIMWLQKADPGLLNQLIAKKTQEAQVGSPYMINNQ